MKKRFIRLFMFVTVITSMGALNSCKDYDEDRYNDLQYKLQEQQASLKALKADFDAKLAAIKQCTCEPKEVLTAKDVEAMIAAALANAKAGLTPEEVADMIAKALADYKVEGLTAAEVESIVNNSLKNYATLTQLENAKKDLNDAIAKVQAALDNKADQEALNEANLAIKNVQSQVNEAATLAQNNKEAIEELKELVNGLSVKDWSAEIQEVSEIATDAKNQAESNYNLILGLQGSYQDLQDQINALEFGANPALVNTVDSLVNVSKNLATKEDIEETKDYAYYLYTLLNTRINSLSDSITALRTDLTALQDTVKKNREDLEAMIKDLRTDLNSMITSIIVQGAKNPVYGYFAMPGVDPNLLIAYYGENIGTQKFPVIGSGYSVYEDGALTQKDADMLGGLDQVPVEDTVMDDEEGNAGKLYLTINPNTVDFTGQTVQLVNSLDEESPIKLSPLAASTDKMTFGWTRANNGFYEAKATLAEADIEAAKIRFDLDAMQSDVEEAIKSKSASSLKGIAKSIYNQLGDMMDANGVKASWTDTEGTEHSIYSQYSVGTAAIKPLSFSFLKDISISIPFVSSLSELTDLNNLIDVTKFNIQLDDISSNFSISVQFDKVYEKAGKYYTQYQLNINGELETGEFCLDYVDADMAAFMNNRADIWSAQLKKEFEVQLNTKLQDMIDQINQMTASISGKLQDAIQDVIDDAQNSLDSKISKVESLFNRINGALSNPNSKLQVCMLYDGIDDNIHQLSNSKTFPTILTGTGSIKIYPTTYTLELVAPAAKKFIAVTNVFKDGTSAQDDDAACKSVLEATNAAENFNEVISGTYNGIDFTPAEAGYVYEIFYSALDYSGKISQRKFYVEVQ